VKSARANSGNGADFESLTAALDGHFDKPFVKLPQKLRERVERDFFLSRPWDEYTGDQRRRAAAQWDYQNDPATETLRRGAWDCAIECGEWEATAIPTALDKVARDTGLRMERERFAALEERLSQARGQTRHDPMRRDIEAAIAELGRDFTPRKVMSRLKSWAGKEGHCITTLTPTGVTWKNSGGTPQTLTLKALGQRLTRRRADREGPVTDR
jgi:hypothetical protein